MSATLVRRRHPPLSILTLVVLALIVAGNAGFYLLEKRVARLRQESRYFADQTGLHMAEHWDPDLLVQQATPELRAQIKEDDLRALSRQVEQFGRLWMFLGVKGKLNDGYMAALGSEATASYVAKASYAPGVVTFDLGLVKRDGHWQIDRFHIDMLRIQEEVGRTNN